MRTFQRETRLRMIEGADPAPALLAMAALTRLSQASLMLVVGLVAIDATVWSIPELDLCLVAAFARRLLMAAHKLKIRERMIEGFFVELNDVGVPALVIGVAEIAIRFCGVGPLAVHAASLLAVAGDILVAGKAKAGL